MESLFPTLVLIVLALVGARFSFSTAATGLGPRLLFRTGTPFVLLGFALGPSGLGLMTPEEVEQLFPLLAIGLGWVGFHFGLQLDRRALTQFPASHYVFALGQALVTFGVFVLGAIGLAALAGFGDAVPHLLVLGAACTAAVTTPAGIALVSTTFGVKGPVRDLLLFTGSIDAIVGITALQITYSLFRPGAVEAGLGALSQLAFVVLALGVGTVCGIVVLWLTRSRPGGEELVLYLLGICAFTAGVALHWDLSPLFVSATTGALVANFSRSAQRIQLVLVRWEKAVYVTFLLLAGVLLQVPTWIVFPLAAGYVALRFVAKVSAGGLLAGVLRLDFELPRRVGIGLIPQGGISIAMAVSAMLLYTDIRVADMDAEALLFTVIVIGVALSELVGPLLTLRLLRRAGEMSTVPARPPEEPVELDR